jgi:tRNA(fMet)-specific endonuclease VapC
MIILDTDHISVLQHEDSPKAVALLEKLEALPAEEVATTVATLEEQSRSWLSLIGRYTDVRQQVAYYDRLKAMFEFFAGWQVVRFDECAAEEFHRLRRQGVRIASTDLKIASITLANKATLLSANLRDFDRVPGLAVENWLTQSP